MRITKHTTITNGLLAAALCLLTAVMAAAAPAPDSKRLARAKDFIADEQWSRAIVELQAAADDVKETSRDEALYWLADCQHQAGDDTAALQTITRLERAFATSRWVHPARSLRVEIAQHLRRDDVLWMLAVPPAPPAPAAPVRPFASPVATTPPAAPSAPVGAAPVGATTPPPAAVPPRPAGRAPQAAPPAPPAAPSGRAPHVPAVPPPPVTPAPPGFAEFWLPPVPGEPDMTVRLQALTGLLDTHSAQVIPLLRQIALDRNSPDEARQAVFVLGQSRQPEARRTVVEVARDGAEPVRIAAVRELGRFDGPAISSELMRVYATSATPRLKRQIVASLGDRADTVSLLRIARSESEPTVRDYAIVTLGRTGPRDQVRTLYVQVPQDSRNAVLTALFTAKDDDELIHIAQTERNPLLRLRARQQLGMLATPKARKFLEENP
jgi:HEAT repeat protein